MGVVPGRERGDEVVRGGVPRSAGYGRVVDGGGVRKVDSFKVESRLEKNDAAVSKRTCDFTNQVSSTDTSNIDCYTPWYEPNGTYTGDGRIYIVIDNDGKTGTWYDLPGSVSIS